MATQVGEGGDITLIPAQHEEWSVILQDERIPFYYWLAVGATDEESKRIRAWISILNEKAAVKDIARARQGFGIGKPTGL